MPLILEFPMLLATLVYSIIESFIMKFVPASPKDIKGKLVLVTGGGRGIGRALALRFSQEGAKLALCDVEKSTAENTAQEIINNGGTARGYACDVTDPKAIKAMANEIRRDLGQVDILVNNAGIMIGKDLLSLTEQDIRRTMEINTIAHFWTLKEFLPVMMARDSGHVVTIASMAAKAGTGYLVDYCASKFGAYGLTEALAVELRDKGKLGVRTTTVCPMFVNTRLISDITHRVERRDRFGEMLEPEDVADAVVRGVLVNKPVVYVPERMKSVDFSKAIFPRRFQLALYTFLDARFVETK